MIRNIISGALYGGIVGLLFSQYFPVFGDIYKKLADPLTPLRLSLIPIHLLCFMILGGISGYLISRIKKK